MMAYEVLLVLSCVAISVCGMCSGFALCRMHMTFATSHWSKYTTHSSVTMSALHKYLLLYQTVSSQ